MAPQNIPRAIALTLGNKVVLYCNATTTKIKPSDKHAVLRVSAQSILRVPVPEDLDNIQQRSANQTYTKVQHVKHGGHDVERKGPK